MALLLPPLARRELRRAPLHLARERQGRAPHLIEAPAALDPHVHVHAARARRLGPAAQAVLGEHVAHDQRHAPHVVPAHARAGIEVDPQLVGMVEVIGPHRVRVQIDAPEVDDPEELRGVAHHDLARRAPGGEAELHRLDPVGTPLGRPLLEERLLLRAIHVALEDDRPRRDPAQRSLGHRGVVLREIELGVAGPREEHLLRVGDHHLAARDFEDRLLRFRHGQSLAESAFAAQGAGTVLH